MWCNKECFEANFDICIIIILFLIKETITMAFGLLRQPKAIVIVSFIKNKIIMIHISKLASKHSLLHHIRR